MGSSKNQLLVSMSANPFFSAQITSGVMSHQPNVEKICGDQWVIHGFFLGNIGHRKRRKAMAFDIVLTIMMMGVSGFNFPMNDLMPGYSKHFNTRIAIGIV